jgi:uncharacterized tellurite resistance protein B-like protein
MGADRHRFLVMSFSFNDSELIAVFNLAQTMMIADGRIDSNEQAALALEAVRLNVTQEKLEYIISRSLQMTAGEAMLTVMNFNDTQKKYVSAFLGAMMAVDGRIDDSEKKMWSLISAFCGLPQMTVIEAITYMKDLSL